MSARILVVDDIEANIRLLQAKLEAEYYEVLTASDGPTALALAASEKPDIVLLDVMMPGMDGFAVCRRMKDDPETRHIPVVLLTALDGRADRVTGLEAGADDYLVKPFAMEELVARMRALTRRGHDATDRLAFADLTLDLRTRVAERGGRSVELTGRESALLELMLRHPRAVVPRDQAIEEIWEEAAAPNVVDRYVTRLRRKLGEPPLIRTVVGRGYRLCDHD